MSYSYTYDLEQVFSGVNNEGLDYFFVHYASPEQLPPELQQLASEFRVAYHRLESRLEELGWEPW